MRIGWRGNRLLICVLGFFILAGIAIGAIAIFDPLLTHFRITRDILDGNIINAATPNRSIFSFFLIRFSDFVFGLLLVLLFSMTKWTVLFTFPYVAFRAFWVVINLYWIVDRFGFLHGFVLFLVYLVVLTALLVLFLCATIFALRRGKVCRQYGFKEAFRWREIRNTVYALTMALALVAFLEWLLYFTILSRMVFVI